MSKDETISENVTSKPKIKDNDEESKVVKARVKVVNVSNNPLPEYATSGSAGLDLRANLQNAVVIPAKGGIRMIPTGLKIQLPAGFECQVRPRSGLAVKNGITVLNAPGTVDSDFTDEIQVILINLSSTPFTVNNNDRIAQAVFARYGNISWEVVDELDETERKGGFGSTGIK